MTAEQQELQVRRAAHRERTHYCHRFSRSLGTGSTRCLYMEGVQLGEKWGTFLQVEIKKSLALACPDVPSPGSQSAPRTFP